MYAAVSWNVGTTGQGAAANMTKTRTITSHGHFLGLVFPRPSRRGAR